MLIDTHAHLNFNAFAKDRNEVIERCLDNDLWMINIGTNFETSKRAVEISKKYNQGVYATIGLHPINLDTGLVKIKTDKLEGKHFEKEFNYEKYKELAKSPKVVAVGEIGLDYYWKPKTKRKLALFKEKQRTVLCQQLKLAEELNLPVIFHCRMAHDDLTQTLLFADILNDRKNYQLIQGVMHGFVGSLEQLKEYLKMGFYIGFNGIIFKTIEGIDFEENIKNTPLERILIETDCPYLIPLPAATSREIVRNEPLYVKYVAQEIAKIKNTTFEKVAEITTQNAKKLFRLE